MQAQPLRLDQSFHSEDIADAAVRHLAGEKLAEHGNHLALEWRPIPDVDGTVLRDLRPSSPASRWPPSRSARSDTGRRGSAAPSWSGTISPSWKPDGTSHSSAWRRSGPSASNSTP